MPQARQQADNGNSLLPYVMIVLVWAVLQASLAGFHDAPIFKGALVDTDSHMRMIRVLELLQGGGWYDDSIARSNAPYGETLHWTRPFDLLLILGAAPLLPFADLKTALYWSGALISPLLLLAAGFAFVWATAPLARGKLWFIAVPLLFVQGAVMAYSGAGRADHHALQMLNFIVLIGFTLHALARPHDRLAAAAAGLVAGFGIWLSIEAFLPLTATLAGLTLAWLLRPDGRLSQLRALAAGLTAMLLLALVAEHPVPHWTTAVYDEISIVHFTVAVLLLCLWTALNIWERWAGAARGPVGRAIALAIAGGLSLFVLYRVFPAFFAGPMVDIDPRITEIWLGNVREIGSILPVDLSSLADFIYFVGTSLIAVPGIVWLLWRERGSTRWLPWLYIATALALALPVAVASLRFSPYAEILSVVVAAELIARMRAWAVSGPAPVIRQAAYGCFLASLLFGPVMVGSSLDKQAKAAGIDLEQQPSCRIQEIAGYLNAGDGQRPAVPRTILALIDHGPELLYRTPHRVIATPYHRNGDGIHDGHFMLASADEDASRRLMRERAVDLVLLCPKRKERAYFSNGVMDGNSLYERLRAGDGPEWLVPLEVPAEVSAEGFQLFNVVR